MDEGRRKPAGSGVELLPHPHPEVRSPAHKSLPWSAVRRCAFGHIIASHTMPEARQDKDAPYGAPCPSLGQTKNPTRAWRGNECACVNGRGCLTIESEKCRWAVEGTNITDVMAGLVPAIPIIEALCPIHRDHRDKPGDDRLSVGRSAPHPRCRPRAGGDP